ncbi:Uncharacterised protein [Mycobacteroides abscessus subsp. abscessus]|nr:Uncharacterised protein [Mycobacteroides abscessus subsp. abscessus]SKV11018.1 Uncharacterised protein [Mycobacteroides abscessus subsp. abscessus]
MKETLAGISGGQRDKRHDIAQPERKRTGFTPPPRPRLDHPNTRPRDHRMDTPPQLTLGSQPPPPPVGGWPGVLGVCLKAARLHVWP